MVEEFVRDSLVILLLLVCFLVSLTLPIANVLFMPLLVLLRLYWY